MLISLLQSIGLQSRVIKALVMREIHTRYGRENIGFLWIIGEPILFCGGVTILWTLIRPAHEHGLPVTAFVITGYVPLTMWRHCVGRAVKAFESNGSLLFHRQVTPLDIITSRCILEVVGTLEAGAIVMVGACLLGFMGSAGGYWHVISGLSLSYCLLLRFCIVDLGSKRIFRYNRKAYIRIDVSLNTVFWCFYDGRLGSSAVSADFTLVS